MEMPNALNVVNVQALAYIAGERILAKLLFLSTTLNKGVLPHIPYYFKGLRCVLDMYHVLANYS